MVPVLLLAEAASEALDGRARLHRVRPGGAPGGRRPSRRSAHLLKQRNTWGIAIPRMLADPTWGTLTFWMPLYLATERGFDIKQLALFAWLPFLTADIGAMTGPTIAFWLQKRGVSLITARKCAFTVGALLMTSMLFVAKVAGPLHGASAAVPGWLCAPDAVDHGHHHVVRPVPQERSGDGGRHCRLLRQPRCAGVHAVDRRTGEDRRLRSVLRGAGRVRYPRRDLALDRGARSRPSPTVEVAR